MICYWGKRWYQVIQKLSWRYLRFTIIPNVFEEHGGQKCVTETLKIRFYISTFQTTYVLISYICDELISADDISQSIYQSGSRILQEIWSLNLRCVNVLECSAHSDDVTLWWIVSLQDQSSWFITLFYFSLILSPKVRNRFNSQRINSK